jgi:hypothetical protein
MNQHIILKNIIMKIDGKKMAERIYSQLEIDVKNSRKKPVLAAVLV